jgi:hypothetical protein
MNPIPLRNNIFITPIAMVKQNSSQGLRLGNLCSRDLGSRDLRPRDLRPRDLRPRDLRPRDLRQGIGVKDWICGQPLSLPSYASS